MDETYIKVNGKWIYLYRAVDKEGNTVSEKRDRPAVLEFFKKAIGSSGLPQKGNSPPRHHENNCLYNDQYETFF